MTLNDPVQFIDLRAQQDRLQPQIEQAIKKVLAHGSYILGPEVGELERALAEFSGAKHVVTCASGTDALLMVLMAKGIRRGDAVFMPSFAFVSTAEVVALLGATPVFVDVNADDFLIDPQSLEAAIEAVTRQGLRPRGVIPVDLFGQPADYGAIDRVAKNHGLFMFADAAQSFGGTRGGKRVGTLAPVTATSFFPAKPLGCYGDGGAIFTDDEGLAQVLRSLRVHGQGQDKYDNVRIGINGRLDTLQAAILIEKLGVFGEEIEARQRVAQRYGEGLGDIVKTPAVAPVAISAWAQYTVRIKGRDTVVAKLKERKVPTAVYYPKPLHQQTAYREFPADPRGLPVSEKLSAVVLSLPMHPYLRHDAQDHVIKSLCDAVRDSA